MVDINRPNSLFIAKITEEEFKTGRIIEEDTIYEFFPNDCITLYEVNHNEHINVGYPALAPYSQIMGNMFGFNKALNKGYFVKVKRELLGYIKYHSLYEIEISNNLTINTIYGVNDKGKTNLLFEENNDIKILSKKQVI